MIPTHRQQRIKDERQNNRQSDYVRKVWLNDWIKQNYISYGLRKWKKTSVFKAWIMVWKNEDNGFASYIRKLIRESGSEEQVSENMKIGKHKEAERIIT